MSGLPAEQIERARLTRIEDVLEGIKLRGRVERVGPCPRCGGVDRFAVNTAKQVFNCRGCGARGDAIALVQFLDGVDFRSAVGRLCGSPVKVRWRASTKDEPVIAASMAKAASERSVRDLASAARIVAEIIPLNSEPRALAYLGDLRKIDVTAIADVLSRTDAIGWHPAVYFNEPEFPRRGDPPHPLHGQRLGAIIAIMTDPATAKPTGAISRTYLAPDGTKVTKAKTLGSPRGVIRLSPDDEVLGGLHVAEGLETALTGKANFGLRPMWATGDCGVMAQFPALGIEAITVIADHDPDGKGEKAAHALEARWLAAGRRRGDVKLLLRDTLGDLNDALRAVL